MTAKPTIEQLKAELRAQICKDCPLRTPGQPFDMERQLPCETSCPLFVHLPRLKEVAQQLDPMLGSYDAVLGRQMSEITRAHHELARRDGRSSPLTRYRKRIIRIFAGLMDRDAGKSAGR